LIPDTHPNIKDKGLDNAIHAAVRLEEIDSRPDRRTLVDLAVVREELPRVEGCLCCITSPLNDLSMVVIADDSADPETRKLLRSVWVYTKYLKAQVEQSGTASSSALEWYTMRIDEINTTMVQIHRKETLILEQAPSVS
jgi:hypothetical protein